MRRKYLILAIITATSLALDQLSKIWIRNNIPLGGRPITVIENFFRIVHAENQGAAWGILRDAEWRIPFFVVTTTIAIGFILYYYYHLKERDTLQATGLALILGGALGNFIDRITYQSVTDFVEVFIGVDPMSSWLIEKFHSNRWPAFNIADAAIVVGIGLILYYVFLIEPKLVREQEASAESGGAAQESA